MTKPREELIEDIERAINSGDFDLAEFFIDTKDSFLWDLQESEVLRLVELVYNEIKKLSLINVNYRANTFVNWMKANMNEAEIFGFYSLIPILDKTPETRTEALGIIKFAIIETQFPLLAFESSNQ